MKIAPEGRPFISFFAVITAISLLAGGILAFPLPFILTLFMVYFFRDPERTVPEGENIFVSPADGRIIQVHNIQEQQSIKGDTIEISIFMSPFDVHVNRAPCSGIVETVVHTPGKFLSAFKPEASLQNENIAMTMTGDMGRILVRQVAGFLARRAVCNAGPGDFLKKGQRYGLIKFSSRLDIYLPEDTEVNVKIGDRVKAGETILGTRRNTA